MLEPTGQIIFTAAIQTQAVLIEWTNHKTCAFFFPVKITAVLLFSFYLAMIRVAIYGSAIVSRETLRNCWVVFDLEFFCHLLKLFLHSLPK
jgi:hypothetical protein